MRCVVSGNKLGQWKVELTFVLLNLPVESYTSNRYLGIFMKFLAFFALEHLQSNSQWDGMQGLTISSSTKKNAILIISSDDGVIFNKSTHLKEDIASIPSDVVSNEQSPSATIILVLSLFLYSDYKVSARENAAYVRRVAIFTS